MMKSKDLKRDNSHLWKKNLNHPFLKEIEDGSLPLKKFQYYLKQDYLYLIQYSKAIALLIAKSQTEKELKKFSTVLQKTIEYEINHHKEYCKEIGIEEELREVEMAPTTTAYTQYLLRTAYEDRIPEVISIILPCFWIYLDMSRELDPGETREEYSDWINMYGSEEFQTLINDLKSILNNYLKDISHSRLNKVEKHFKRGIQYEYRFWEMSYNIEKWKI